LVTIGSPLNRCASSILPTATARRDALAAAIRRYNPSTRYVLAHLGDPYVWGAEGPHEFDCSGLTLAAYRQTGIRLPHQAALQVRYGRPVGWRREPIQPGDLLFLRGGVPVHDYGHVGIAMDQTRWINAPRSGDVVKTAPLPYGRLQAVRRLVSP
jgi:cell wall-associated NlpC family hydrolase